MRSEKKYHAFISYSHSDCGTISPYIQKGIENIGKPWYTLYRNLEVFRDETNLTASPQLWPTIEEALMKSDYLVLLASPLTAKSGWIADEILVWEKKNYTPKEGLLKIFIVLTEGEIAWDKKKNDFDWELTNCLPLCLKGKFISEPNWVDLKPYVKILIKERHIDYKAPGFTTAITKIIGAITGKSPRDIESSELRRRQRTIQIIAAACILFSAIILSAFFLYRANIKQGQVSKSNYLIYQANKIQSSNINEALFTYAESYKYNPDSSIFSILNEFYKDNIYTTAYKRNIYDSLAITDTINHFYKTFSNIPEVDSTSTDYLSLDYIRGNYNYLISKNAVVGFWKDQLFQKEATSSKVFKKIVDFGNAKRSSSFFNSNNQLFFVVNNYPDVSRYFLSVFDASKNAKSEIITKGADNLFRVFDKPGDIVLTRYISALKYNNASLFDAINRVDNNSEIASVESAADGRYILVAPKWIGSNNSLNSNSFFSKDFFTVLLIDLSKHSYTLHKIKTDHSYDYKLALKTTSISPDNKFIYFQYDGTVSTGSAVIYDLSFKPILKFFENNEWSTKLNNEAPDCSYWKISPDGKPELFYGTPGGNVYIINMLGLNEGNKNPYLVKCTTPENYGAIKSIIVTDRYIFAGTDKGNVIVWQNENMYSQKTELEGYQFLTAIKLPPGENILKLFFDPGRNALFCMNSDGVLWRIFIKRTISLDKKPGMIKNQLNKLEIDTTNF